MIADTSSPPLKLTDDSIDQETGVETPAAECAETTEPATTNAAPTDAAPVAASPAADATPTDGAAPQPEPAAEAPADPAPVVEAPAPAPSTSELDAFDRSQITTLRAWRDDVKSASAVVDDAEKRWNTAKKVASAAKAEWEAAVERLQEIVSQESDALLPFGQHAAAAKRDEATKATQATDATPAASGLEDWRSVELATLGLRDGILAALHEAEIKTVGDISKWTDARKALIDIKGIGPKSVEAIEEALMPVWRAHGVVKSTAVSDAATAADGAVAADAQPCEVAPTAAAVDREEGDEVDEDEEAEILGDEDEGADDVSDDEEDDAPENDERGEG